MSPRRAALAHGGANSRRATRPSACAPVRLHDLAPRVGLAREAMDVIVGRMAKWGLATIAADPTASRGRVAQLTGSGLRARAEYLPTTDAVAFDWRRRYGERELVRLREELIAAVGEPGGGSSPLWAGLKPHPEGWRASLPAPECLPHYPLVTHRGGYPDGS